MKEQNLKKIVATRPPSPEFQPDKQIDLSHHPMLSEDAILGKFTATKNPENILSVNLSGLKHVSQKVVAIIIQTFPNLKCLNLSFTNIGDKAVTLLKNKLHSKNLSQLAKLYLNDLKISADTCTALKAWAKTHQHSTTIYLDDSIFFTETPSTSTEKPLDPDHPAYATFDNFMAIRTGFTNRTFIDSTKLPQHDSIQIGPVTFINTGITPSTQR
ncbi:hypothetical protein HOC37_06830 [bacterium]|nr:hypothetical protein [bacterium]MBT3582062.1 hypothetical protein [bacterium]MBT4552673.1 hypothetical protein [bacterium]MBT7088309.1 hypothetical protein [bacterium]